MRQFSALNTEMKKGRQTGAALLVFILLVTVLASTWLLSNLNDSIRYSVYSPASSLALKEAKDALQSWAVSHPFNPGTLPMPDQNVDGDYDGDADCTNDPVTADMLIGKLPWRGAPVPCKDAADVRGLATYARDQSGEVLWYAVSKNLVYENPDYPFISPGLLERTSNWLTVLDENGTPISTRVAFVLIAPGPALSSYTDCDGLSYSGQDRSGTAPDITNYLDSVTIGGDTYSNADFDEFEEDFIIYPNSSVTDGDSTLERCDQFNDQLVFVTIDELINDVQRRVINETGNILSAYHNTHDALPWLSPYADPKAEIPVISGESENFSSTTLQDSGVNFVNAGVKPGDVVQNTTTGSIGFITSVGFPNDNMLDVGGLAYGTNSNFNPGDEYHIIPLSADYFDDHLSGTATIGSNGLLLENINRDFIEIGVRPGDIIKNITNNVSSGVISDVTATTITVASLTGGTLDNTFELGDEYIIYSNMGVANGGSNVTLTDSNADFSAMGVAAGDVVINLSDGSYGRVSNVAASTLTFNNLLFGLENDFDASEAYLIAKQNALSGTRQGRVALHQYGMPFRTSFNADWSLSSTAPVITIPVDFPHAAYSTDLNNKARTNSALGTININSDNGQCFWLGLNFAECSGYYMDDNFPVQGTVTTGTNTSVLTDANANFVITAVKRGDIVNNYDDEIAIGISGTTTAGSGDEILEDTSKNFTSSIIPYYHMIHNNSDSNARGLVTEIINDTTLRIVPFGGGRPPMDIDPGENYTFYAPQRMVVTIVNSATQLQTQRINTLAPDFDSTGAGATGTYQEYYQINVATGRLSGTIDGGSGAFLLDAGTDFSDIRLGDIIENTTDNAYGIITYVDDAADIIGAQTYAADGTTRSHNAGEGYRIYYNHDVIHRRYEIKTRFSNTASVYDSAGVRKRDICLGYNSACAGTPANVTVPVQTSLVTIRDLDNKGIEVGRAVMNVPSSGAMGSLKISGIDFYLSEVNDEMPEWFIRNKWHQYVFIAYSDKEAPGVGNICTEGTDCLTLNLRDASSVIYSFRDDIRALIMVSGGELATQSWPGANISNYFDDGGNIDFNDVFDKYPGSNSFNDVIRIAESCAADATKLCWSY